MFNFSLQFLSETFLILRRNKRDIIINIRGSSAPVQTGPGAHPASCTMGYWVFPGCKERPGRDADPSPPSSAVVMEEYDYTSTPTMGLTACTELQCLYKGALYLYLIRFLQVKYSKISSDFNET